MKNHLSIVKMILAVVLALSLCISAVALADDTVYTVGICQLVQHDALDAATQGFEDTLKSLLGEDKVVFDYQVASVLVEHSGALRTGRACQKRLVSRKSKQTEIEQTFFNSYTF